MPAYAAQRRGSQVQQSRRRRGSALEADDDTPAPPAELSIQQQLGLVQGVPLDSPRDGDNSPKLFDAAHAAMCLLKEEDHVWTIETCMETINLLRGRNNTLKAQLLEVDTNFNDHVQARQKIIDELKQEADALVQAKDQVEAALESERGDRRRTERDQGRQRETETDAFKSIIKNLTEEVESLQAFAGDRDRVNAKIAALVAENEELKDQQETRLHSLRKQLAIQKEEKDRDVQRLLLEERRNLREEVEIAFGGEYERLFKENGGLKDEINKLDAKLKGTLSDLVRETSLTSELRREGEIMRSLETKSSGKIKYYMRMLKRSAEISRHAEGDNESLGPPAIADPIKSTRRESGKKTAKRPETAPVKQMVDARGDDDAVSSAMMARRRPSAASCNCCGGSQAPLNDASDTRIMHGRGRGAMTTSRTKTARSLSAGTNRHPRILAGEKHVSATGAENRSRKPGAHSSSSRRRSNSGNPKHLMKMNRRMMMVSKRRKRGTM